MNKRVLSTRTSTGNAGVSQHPRASSEFRVEVSSAPLRVPIGGAAKRAMDIGIAVSALTALLPLMCIVATVVRLTSGGPVIFGHRRVGFAGRHFNCLKFRTMAPNSEALLRDHLARNPDAALEWCETFKLRNDPRITRAGRILRKTSLDELPQLINVLFGEMSCVGPRPVVDAELSRYGTQASDYLSTRPGLTGLWQISGRNNISYSERVDLDSTYARNWSLARDFRILFATVPAVLSFDQTD